MQSSIDEKTSTPVTSPAEPPAQPTSNVKETIESILVAFILAFIFRAFIVEAFVIPTGSMAPTLMGAHLRFHCPDCGYSFTTNFQANTSGDELVIPARATRSYTVFCPNCGFRMPPNQAEQPAVHYGDRILVLKYAYLFSEPKRWDVVVFKSPDPVPGADLYQTNYIKRLVGKPGESILILDGDVYVGPPESDDVAEFKIQTKPRYAQEALWRVVYDNDYHPIGRARVETARWKQPWKIVDGDGWDLGKEPDSTQKLTPAPGREFQFKNMSGASTLTFDRNANREQNSLTDWLSYDGEGSGAAVSDLKFRCYYQRTEGDGPLQLILTKYDDRFIAEFKPGTVALFHERPDGSRVQVGASFNLPGHSAPLQVEFQNVDYQVTLRIGGKIAIQTTVDDYHPDPDFLLKRFQDRVPAPFPSVSIQAENQAAALSHLGLWRDVFYINSRPDYRSVWAGPTEFPNSVMRLGQKEFFVLGDNSLISGDARMWELPINLPHEDLALGAGRVPERFLLGKAFFVYWPAGYRPADFSPSIVPNFGDMRFIH